VKGNGRTYFTDDWPVYRAVLPEAQHVIGRLGTQTVERDNANTRHYSARMARRTKVVSKSLTMVDLSIKLGIVFGDSDIYAQWQAVFLSVFT
jgi:insertion element IS1 protein InsB